MKKFVAFMMAIIMVVALTACGGSSDNGSTNESKKSSTSELGCEITDYMLASSSTNRVGQFISDNQLEYDSESGYYKNDYIAIYTNDKMDTIISAAITKAGNYTLFNVDVGDELDRDITTSRLNRNNLPLYSDEGNRIVYSSSSGGPVFYIRLEDDGTVGFVLYEMRGMDYVVSLADDDSQEAISNYSVTDIYKTLSTSMFQEGSGITGSFTEKALTFIDNHQNLFVGNDPNNESATYMSDDAFDYRKYSKSAENYPLSIEEVYQGTIIDIWEENLDDGTCMTYGILENNTMFADSDEVTYLFIAPGSFDIYVDDCVDVLGLPLGNGTYQSIDGGSVKCVFFAITSMEVYNDYDYNGYDY